MRLRVYFAADGDCLLLTSGDGRHVLIDGGRKKSFEENTRPDLAELAAAGEPLDLVVVSHIDADHITGVISLLKEVSAWVVHDHQVGDGGNPNFPEPATPRPPEVRALWHNSWRAQLKDLEGPVSALTSQVTEALEVSAATAEEHDPVAALALDAMSGLAESITDGVKLLRLVDDETPIARNEAFDKGLVLLRSPVHEEQVGTTVLRVIGPADRHLRKLRDEWREWIARQPASVRGRDASGPGRGSVHSADGVGPTSGGDSLPMTPAQGRAVVEDLVAAAVAAQPPTEGPPTTQGSHPATSGAKTIEEPRSSAVSPPNRASIALLAEEDGHTILLTGDAAEEELLEGLDAAGCFVGDEPFWCDVLKVQHHGSEYNLSKGFATRVLAEHYVFSADGAHGNPSPDVLKTLLEARLEDPRPFTVWFTCSAERAIPQRRKALRAALAEAHRLESAHKEQLTVRILDDDRPYFDIEL